MTPKITVREVLEKIRDGEFSIETYGHEVGHWGTKEFFVEELELLTQYANGKGDGTWNLYKNPDGKEETMEERNQKMRAFYQRDLDHEIFGKWDPGYLPRMRFKVTCFNCAEQLLWYVNLDKKCVELIGTYDDKYNVITKPEGEHECAFKGRTSFKDSINITGKIIFANHFGQDDEPEGNKYSDKWNLNYLAGRENITHFKATKQNTAYGQMGNMSVAIYYSNAKKEIIVTSPFLFEGGYDDDEIRENQHIAYRKKVMEGFTHMGDISLAVWRWEATDLNETTKPALEAFKEERNDIDFVEFDVPQGTWDFEHFYDFIRRSDEDKDDSFIYSRFKLRK